MIPERQTNGKEQLTSPERRQQLSDTIYRTEQLRVQAPSYTEEGEVEFDDRKYLQALLLTVVTITELESKNILQSTEDEPTLAAGAHFYAMGATILQSRAKHTLEFDKHKETALNDAQRHINKLLPLAEKLEEKDYYKSVDGIPFIWPLELQRIQARNKARYPDKDKQNLLAAKNHYQQAVEFGLQVYNQPDLDQVTRGCAIMGSATARIEVLQMQLELAEHQGAELNRKNINQEIEIAQKELEESKELGYINEDRKRANLDRIQKVQEKITD